MGERAAKLAPVPETLGKSEQRVRRVIESLKATKGPVGYGHLIVDTGATYDSLLYICTTLIEVGLVQRTAVPGGLGRPSVLYEWVGERSARAMGARRRATA